jgi:hypothetical protein
VHLLANGQPVQATLPVDEDMKHTWPSNEEEEKDPKDGIDWIFRIHGGWSFLKALREQLSWGVDTCGYLCFVCKVVRVLFFLRCDWRRMFCKPCTSDARTILCIHHTHARAGLAPLKFTIQNSNCRRSQATPNGYISPSDPKWRKKWDLPRILLIQPEQMSIVDPLPSYVLLL